MCRANSTRWLNRVLCVPCSTSHAPTKAGDCDRASSTQLFKSPCNLFAKESIIASAGSRNISKIISESIGSTPSQSSPLCVILFFIERFDSSTNSEVFSIPVSMTSALACPPTKIANLFLAAINSLTSPLTPASLASLEVLILHAERIVSLTNRGERTSEICSLVGLIATRSK